MNGTGTYTKLRDGNWGVRLDGVFDKGALVEACVTKRSGERKTEYCRIMWSGTDKRTGKPISLAAIQRENNRSNGSRRSNGRAPMVERRDGKSCWECGGTTITKEDDGYGRSSWVCAGCGEDA